MPTPRLSGVFASDPCEFRAELGTESVTFSFDRAKLNLRRDRELKRAAENEDVDGMVASLAGVLLGWDVVDEQGQPVPFSAEILLDLSVKAVQNLIEGLSEAAQPSSEEGNDSGTTSSIPSIASSSKPESPPNGPLPSPSPEPSASPSPT